MAPLNCHKLPTSQSYNTINNNNNNSASENPNGSKTITTENCSDSKNIPFQTHANSNQTNGMLQPGDDSVAERSPGDGCDVPNGPAELTRISAELTGSDNQQLQSPDGLLQQNVTRQDEDLQFPSLLPPKDLGPSSNFTHTFLKSILTSINSKDPG